MDLEVFEAFRSAGVPDDRARAAVESINRQIDYRYSLHADQLATRGDLRAEVAGVRAELLARIAEGESAVIRWCVGSIFASVGMFAAITKLLTH